MSIANHNPINGSHSHIVAMPYLGIGIGGGNIGQLNSWLRSIPNVIPSEHNRTANFVGFLDPVFSEMEGPFNELLDRIKRKTSRIVADIFFSVVGCYFSSGIVDNGAVGDGGCGRRCGRRWWWGSGMVVAARGDDE
ncbi:hypothetical protein LguiA_000394 [Lonicera macranthoides]